MIYYKRGLFIQFQDLNCPPFATTTRNKRPGEPIGEYFVHAELYVVGR